MDKKQDQYLSHKYFKRRKKQKALREQEGMESKDNQILKTNSGKEEKYLKETKEGISTFSYSHPRGIVSLDYTTNPSEYVYGGKCDVIPVEEYTSRNEGVIEASSLHLLKRHLQSVWSGSKTVIKTPFMTNVAKTATEEFEHEEDSVLSVIKRLLVKAVNYYEVFGLSDYDLENLEIFGEYSPRLPFEHNIDRVEKYFIESDSHLDMDILNQAISEVADRFDENSMYPQSIDTVFDSSDKTTNWGPPFFKRGNIMINDKKIAEYHLDIAKYIIETGIVPFKMVSYVVQRVQYGGFGNTKQRVAWAVQHSLVLIELMFQKTILEFYKHCPEACEWNERIVANKHITELINEALLDDLTIFGVDFSGYDTNIKSIVVRKIIFDIYGRWFPDQFKYLLDIISDFICKSDYITPIGVFVGRDGSMPSGAGLTNMIDTHYQEVMARYCCIKNGLIYRSKSFAFQGDDGIWSAVGLSIEMIDDVCKDFGGKLNVSKSVASKLFTVFCNRLYSSNYRDNQGICLFVKSIYRLFDTMVYKERFPGKEFTSRDESVRVIMQLEEFINHPCYEDVLDLMIRCDEKYGLGVTFEGGPIGLLRAGNYFTGTASRQKVGSWEKERTMRLDKELEEHGLKVINDLERIYAQKML